MAVQTTYGQTMAVGIAGLIYDMRNIVVESYACESSGGILFGQAVAPGTDPRKQVKSPTGAGQGFRGIALLEQTHEQDTSTGVAKYAQYETVNVMRRGAVWVQTTGSVTENSAAFYVAASGLWASSGETTNGIFRTATTGSGLAVVEISLP